MPTFPTILLLFTNLFLLSSSFFSFFLKSFFSSFLFSFLISFISSFLIFFFSSFLISFFSSFLSTGTGKNFLFASSKLNLIALLKSSSSIASILLFSSSKAKDILIACCISLSIISFSCFLEATNFLFFSFFSISFSTKAII